jgi:hypothetical protein
MSYSLSKEIQDEIRKKIPEFHKYIEVFADWNSVKLDGTYTMDELTEIIKVFKKYNK